MNPFAEIASRMKNDIRNIDFESIKNFFAEKGLPLFHAKQVYEWLWKKSARTFDAMTNLSKETRNMLKENFSLNAISVGETQRSKDFTVKNAFRLYDGNIIEGVLIPTKTRMTACVSTQVGCSLSCKFCATGKLERIRNLNADEIFDQVSIMCEQAETLYKIPLSNIVYMGMGEPLLNYKNVLSSIERITSTDGLGMSPRRITVSTAGISKMIKKSGDDGVKFNLALSLHAANDEKRSRIMPVNDQNSLESLREALSYFHEKTGTRITFEYIILKNFNDEIKDAMELALFARAVPCKVNIIEYNPIDNGEFQKAESGKVERFAKFLESKNMIVNIRSSRGKDIDAACGQLANKNKLQL